MILHPQAKRSLIIGTLLLALAVLLGAFGAHGLKKILTPAMLVTFETGVRYHFYHAFGLLFVGFLQQTLPSINLNVSSYSFLSGIFLFSFNLYLYTLTGIKTFAMIVPVGGILFTLGWIMLSVRLLRLR